jgi:hypothetical protein
MLKWSKRLKRKGGERMGGRVAINRNQGEYRIPQFTALGLAMLLAGCGSTTNGGAG